MTDLRRTLRSLRKAPGFTGATIVTLALGIGAVTAVYSVVDGVLLRPLPYRDADQLVALWEDHSRQGGLRRFSVTPSTFEDLRAGAGVFEGLAAHLGWGYTLSSERPVEIVWTGRVTHEFFEVLGAEAALGRTFTRADEAPVARKVVVLSHGLWARRFGSDPAIVGREIRLDGVAYTAVGVMPADFWFPWHLRAVGGRTAQMWVPLHVPDKWNNRGARVLQVVGRLPTDRSLSEARSVLDGFALQLQERYPKSYRGIAFNLVPLSEQYLGEAATPLLLLLGAVGFVLLIACANAANLSLARSLSRRRETAVLQALGASRLRIVRRHLVEAAVLAAGGAIIGLLAASWGVDLLHAMIPPDVPRSANIGIDVRVLIFAATITVSTVLLFGLWPALSAIRVEPRNALSGVRAIGDRGTPHKGRDVLVVAQVALAALLLVGAGLMVRSLTQLQNVKTGFRADHVLTLRVPLPATRYPEPEERAVLHTRLGERFSTLPGVVAVGATSRLPLEPAYGMSPLFIAGRSNDPDAGHQVGHRVVLPGYFRTLEIPLHSGRPFGTRDGSDSPPVALINRTLARQLWGDEDPLGERIMLGSPQSAPREIIGVVGSVSHDGLAAPPIPEVYEPLAQAPGSGLAFVLRTTAEPTDLAPVVRREVSAVDDRLPLMNVQSLGDLQTASVATERFATITLGALSWVALILGVVGIYGVISFLATRRTAELGLRKALGADAAAVQWLVLRKGLGLAMAGLTVGLTAAFGLTRLLSSLLYEVSTTDLATFGSVAAVLLLAALAASYVPAKRAARTNPLEALRFE